jgi:hypothetical protein
MRPDPRCLIDPRSPCHGCLAAGPVTCPYRYLLGTDAVAHRAAARDGVADRSPEKAGGTP